MADINVDLKVDTKLLDARFDGYKLSLDSLPIRKQTLETAPERVTLSEDQYSLQHIKAFTADSLLCKDPYHENQVYYIDESWQVLRTVLLVENTLCTLSPVFTCPHSDQRAQCPERVTPSLVFASSSLAVLCDGMGHLHVLDTQDRTQDGAEWKLAFSCQPIAKNTPMSVKTACVHKADELTKLECVCVYIVRSEDENSKTAFMTMVEWLTFIQVGDSWQIERTRRLESRSCPYYFELEETGSAILLAADKPVKFKYDSLKAVEEVAVGWEVEEDVKVGEQTEPKYTWSQVEDEINVYLPLPPGTTKDCISVDFQTKQIEVKVKEGQICLTGELHAEVKVKESTWIINEESKLQMVLTKCTQAAWPTLLVGDDQGKEILEPEKVAEINDRLEAVTSDVWNPDPSKKEQPFNTQQLEECDLYPEEASALYRVDGEDHKITHKVNLDGNQWLFNTYKTPSRPASVCLRHDVDGLIWQPHPSPLPGQCPWHHVATFNAFGYVVASKTQRRFCGCSSPDFSYVAVSDPFRHVYIYRQPSGISSPLRNRKTGVEIKAIAKQQLISLETGEEIVGMAVTHFHVFLLTNSEIYVVKIQDE